VLALENYPKPPFVLWIPDWLWAPLQLVHTPDRNLPPTDERGNSRHHCPLL